MHSVITRLIESYSRFGWTGLQKRLAYYGCVHGWLFGVADIQILGLLGVTMPDGPALFAGYDFSLASPFDLDDILLCVPFGDRRKLAELFRGFFARGFRCAIARNNSAVVGFNWAFTGECVITPDDYRHSTVVSLDSRSIFTGNAYVAPEHRGRGVIRQLKSLLFGHYPKGTSFYTAVNDLNASSLRANTHMGFQQLATVRYLITPFGARTYLKKRGDDRWVRLHRQPPALHVVQASVIAD